MKILIVKLGALGDVLRTTPLLSGFRRKYPDSKITWLVDVRHRDILEGDVSIDELISYSPAAIEKLTKETYDLAINLDKETEALDAIMAARASGKLGFGRDKKGALCALDALSAYAYRLGVDDELKFRQNKKTYQEISFEQAGLAFQKEPYSFHLDEVSQTYADKHLTSLGVHLNSRQKPIVGINTGSGDRFAGKRLPVASYVELARKFYCGMKATVFLLGGRDEIERNAEIARLADFPVVNTGSHTIRQFAAIVKNCDLIVSGDTTAMHIAIAVGVPVIAYFGSTCAAEIELYGRGAKIVSEISCAPCYKKICPIDEQCMKDVQVKDIYKAAERFFTTR